MRRTFTGSTVAALAYATTVLAMAAGPAWTAQYIVAPDGSGDYPNIQAAVDAALSGDQVVLLDGTFTGVGNRDVTIFAEAIVVRSLSGNPANCIIDCGRAGRGFYFEAIQSGSVALEGVTIVNGGNEQWGLAGAVFCWRASPKIWNCIFRANTAWEGGAVFGDEASPLIDRCLFVRNRAVYAPGGALFFGIESAPTIRNCTIVENDALPGIGGGIGCGYSSTVTVEHSIIAGSVGTNAAFCYENSVVTLSCSDVFGNEGGDWVDCLSGQEGLNGNFGADPLFCNATSGDFHLQAGSPCAPPGNTGCGLVGALPVGCDVLLISHKSWGAIKARYR